MLVGKLPWVVLCCVLIQGVVGCCAAKNSDKPSGVIELPRVVDGAMAYQTDPFTRTVQDIQLFDGEAPCILITHDSVIGRVGRWRTQTLLIAKAGPGEVIYDVITVLAHSGYDADSGDSYYAEHFWTADVNGDGFDDLLILQWRWGGSGWFEGDPIQTAPENEPVGLRVIIRKVTNRGHPLGITSDESYSIDEVGKAGVKAEYVSLELKSCNDATWKERLRYVEAKLRLTNADQ